MPALKASVTVSVILGFIAIIGCRACSSPHDYTGPVISSGDCNGCRSSERAGSAFAGTMAQHDRHVVNAAENSLAKDPGEHDSSKQTTVVRSKVVQPRQLGRPLTREDVDPFVRLGIPPENIVSVTDRPLEQTIDENPQPLPHSLASGDIKAPKPLPSQQGEDGATATGWVRLGERTSATLR